jgi:hypothetical protein
MNPIPESREPFAYAENIGEDYHGGNETHE